MRITYRTLGRLIANMTDDQKDSDVTLELVDGETYECFPAHLRIVGENHDSLDEGHPVIYCDTAEESERVDDIEEISLAIGLPCVVHYTTYVVFGDSDAVSDQINSGSEPNDLVCPYSFETRIELDAFLMGIAAHDGWIEVSTFDSEDEAIEEIKSMSDDT